MRGRGGRPRKPGGAKRSLTVRLDPALLEVAAGLLDPGESMSQAVGEAMEAWVAGRRAVAG